MPMRWSTRHSGCIAVGPGRQGGTHPFFLPWATSPPLAVKRDVMRDVAALVALAKAPYAQAGPVPVEGVSGGERGQISLATRPPWPGCWQGMNANSWSWTMC